MDGNAGHQGLVGTNFFQLVKGHTHGLIQCHIDGAVAHGMVSPAFRERTDESLKPADCAGVRDIGPSVCLGQTQLADAAAARKRDGLP